MFYYNKPPSSEGTTTLRRRTFAKTPWNTFLRTDISECSDPTPSVACAKTLTSESERNGFLSTKIQGQPSVPQPKPLLGWIQAPAPFHRRPLRPTLRSCRRRHWRGPGDWRRLSRPELLSPRSVVSPWGKDVRVLGSLVSCERLRLGSPMAT